MHRYQDALFMQTEHLRFLRTGTGVRYYEAFERAMRQEEYEGDDYAELPEGLTYAVMQRICERGEPAYIASQIIDTINDALPTFEPEPLLPTDMFTAEGFAYFPRPVFITDVNGDSMPVRAMAWTPIRGEGADGMDRGGVWMVYLTHRDDHGPEERRNWPHGSLTPLHSFWMPYNDLAYALISDERYRDAARQQWCAAQVLWRLAGQVVKTVTRAPRPARRDAKRHGVEQDHVVVVTLRKVQSITSGGELIESEADSAHYSVQFPVRGHWHTYHYKAVGPRQVWVDSYWKGPEDAPVQNSRRVFEVTR
jgi:hypothetical protein